MGNAATAFPRAIDAWSDGSASRSVGSSDGSASRSVDHGPAHVCSACAERYDRAGFLSLALVERLAPGQLGELFTSWPWRSDAALELRRCGCGATLGWLDEELSPMMSGAGR